MGPIESLFESFKSIDEKIQQALLQTDKSYTECEDYIRHHYDKIDLHINTLHMERSELLNSVKTHLKSDLEEPAFARYVGFRASKYDHCELIRTSYTNDLSILAKYKYFDIYTINQEHRIVIPDEYEDVYYFKMCVIDRLNYVLFNPDTKELALMNMRHDTIKSIRINLGEGEFIGNLLHLNETGLAASIINQSTNKTNVCIYDAHLSLKVEKLLDGEIVLISYSYVDKCIFFSNDRLEYFSMDLHHESIEKVAFDNGDLNVIMYSKRLNRAILQSYYYFYIMTANTAKLIGKIRMFSGLSRLKMSDKFICVYYRNNDEISFFIYDLNAHLLLKKNLPLFYTFDRFDIIDTNSICLKERDEKNEFLFI